MPDRNEYETSDAVVRKKTIISFLVFAAAIAFGVAGWLWLSHQPLDQGLTGGVQKPLRNVLDGNEKLFKKVYSQQKPVKTYPKAKAVKNVRVNGMLGLESKLDTNWKLQLVKSTGDTLFITLDDIKKLPKTEIVYDFKCIEGWNQVTHWAGVRFSDLTEHYHLGRELLTQYVGLVTPDEEYYVGIDMPSAMHPQTLLCYEMNGAPLPLNQGYPLRLIIPVKYGVKSLKRIGSIYFSNERPKDYWFEHGYDYYLGL